MQWRCSWWKDRCRGSCSINEDVAAGGKQSWQTAGLLRSFLEHRFKISVDCFRPHCQRNVKVQQYIVHSCWLVRLEVYVCKRAFQHEVCIICSNPFSFTNIYIYIFVYIHLSFGTYASEMHAWVAVSVFDAFARRVSCVRSAVPSSMVQRAYARKCATSTQRVFLNESLWECV